MKHLFEFEPEYTNISLKCAFALEPKLFNNNINFRMYNGLLLVTSGILKYSFENGEFSAKSGSLIYLPAGSMPYSYSISPDDNGDPPKFSQIEFSIFDQKLQKTISYSQNPTLLFEASPEIVNHFSLVISHFEQRNIFSPIMLYADFLYILAKCREQISKNPENSKITPALVYIHENYTKKISVSKLASLCFLSESQLRRLFINKTGKTPIAYKNEILTNSAKILLKSNTLSVSEISEMLGFCDIYAFSHFFTTNVGISPKEYQKQGYSKSIKNELLE